MVAKGASPAIGGAFPVLRSSTATGRSPKAADTTTTTAAAQLAAAPSPACPAAPEAAGILGAGTNTFTEPICEGGFGAGRASNQVDFGYLLQATDGSWARASDAVENEVCTTNPQGSSPGDGRRCVP